MDNLTSLARRDHLPEDMRALVREFPRQTWEGRTGPFTAFYLERHELFRRLIRSLIAENEAFLDGTRDPAKYAKAVARLGSMFLNELQGHHQIEDQHYFPLFQKLDRRAERAIDLLEGDHHDLHDVLDRFHSLGNGAISALDGDGRFQAADRFLTALGGTERLLLRHLADEEDIVVPLMLKYGEDSIGH